ncbi:MAG: hypothetical protein J6M60_00205 [Clostridia bacterium]|nr:hypothetical protein [Clostridia bacterium]
MKKIIICFCSLSIMLIVFACIVRLVLSNNREVENATKYIVLNQPFSNLEEKSLLGKTEYPEVNYVFLDDTELEFYKDGNIYVERSGEFQFFIDQQCKNPISVDPVFISSEIVLCENSYAVLAEDNRIFYFPVGGKIPHLISPQ